MKIVGKDFDIVWESRRNLTKEKETGFSPLFYEQIALYSKTGEAINVKEIEGLYADYREIDSFAEWLKMNQQGPRSIRNVYGGNTDYESFYFTEPDLGLRRSIINSEDVRLTFIFDWREDKPDTFIITVNEIELSKAADEYLKEAGHHSSGREYEVVDYSPEWPELYKNEVIIISHYFGEDLREIHHVGSTSVPGMKGKPQIDILMIVDDINQVDRHNNDMIAAGYEPMGEVVKPGTRYFTRKAGNRKLANVHIYPKDHEGITEYLAVRDYLRKYPEVAKEYSTLKQRLYEKYKEDYSNYRKHKDEYMRGLYAKALVEWKQ